MRRYILYMSYVRHVQLLNTKKFTLGLITLERWFKNIWQQCCAKCYFCKCLDCEIMKFSLSEMECVTVMNANVCMGSLENLAASAFLLNGFPLAFA